jgi:hypothetical protein
LPSILVDETSVSVTSSLVLVSSLLATLCCYLINDN